MVDAGRLHVGLKSNAICGASKMVISEDTNMQSNVIINLGTNNIHTDMVRFEKTVPDSEQPIAKADATRILDTSILNENAKTLPGCIIYNPVHNRYITVTVNVMEATRITAHVNTAAKNEKYTAFLFEATA